MDIVEDDYMTFLKNSLNGLLIVFSLSTFFFINKQKQRLIFFLFCLFVFFNIFFDNKSYFNYIVTISLLTLAAQVPWRKLIESVFFIYILNIILLLSLSYFVSAFFLFDDRFGYRFTAGFENPNTFSLYLIILYSVSILYIEQLPVSKGLLSITSFLLYLLLFFLVYLTFSRTGMALLSIFFVFHQLSLLFNKSRLSLKRKKISITFTLLFLSIASSQFISIALFKSSALVETINTLLSGRVWHSYNLVDALGMPSAFGVDIERYLPIDFYFVNVIYSLGFVCCIIFSYFIFKKIFRTKMTLFMGASLIVFTLLTLTESYFSVLFYSTALFIIFHKNDEYVSAEKCN